MGPASSALLGLVGTAGVAASKVSQVVGKSEGQKYDEEQGKKANKSQISEANDADKNEMMAEKAKLNAYKLITQKIKARTERRNARLKDMKSKQAMKDFKDTLKKESD